MQKFQALLLAAAVIVMVGCGSPQQPLDPGTVGVRDNSFAPDPLEVVAGTTVTWVWQGRAPHDVVGDGFASEIQDSGRFEHTFDTPGTYDYVCTLHAGMTGTVVVTS